MGGSVQQIIRVKRIFFSRPSSGARPAWFPAWFPAWESLRLVPADLLPSWEELRERQWASVRTRSSLIGSSVGVGSESHKEPRSCSGGCRLFSASGTLGTPQPFPSQKPLSTGSPSCWSSGCSDNPAAIVRATVVTRA